MVITGAQGGLGKAIARLAFSQGWRLALIDREPSITEDAPPEALSIVADVTDPASMRGALEHCKAELGSIDCLVSSAGLTRPGPSAALAREDWETVLTVDLSGAFFVAQAAYPYLRASAGSIVNISSISATRVMPGRAAYSAAKAGLNALTQSLAVEWGPDGIRVNAVAPAWVDNAFLRSLERKGVLDPEELVSKIPLGRLCTDDDVAQAVCFLANRNAASFITGQVLHIDGGYLSAG